LSRTGGRGVKLALNGDQLPGVSKQFSAAQPDHGMPQHRRGPASDEGTAAGHQGDDRPAGL